MTAGRVILGRWKECARQAHNWHERSVLHRRMGRYVASATAQLNAAWWHEEKSRLFDEYVLTPDN